MPRNHTSNDVDHVVPDPKPSRAIFGDDVTKWVEILGFINAYNHYMNGVDVAD